MTVRELKELIRGVVREVVDPDYGLELRPEVEAELRESLKRKEKGKGNLFGDGCKGIGT